MTGGSEIGESFDRLKNVLSEVSASSNLGQSEKEEIISVAKSALFDLKKKADWLKEFVDVTFKSRDEIRKTIRDEFLLNAIKLGDVFRISPGAIKSEWDGSYETFSYGSNRSLVRPRRPLEESTVELLHDNAVKISPKSVGVYIIFDNDFFYVGKTNGKMLQRFDAHITKIAAINNGRHHHPKKWRDFAKARYSIMRPGDDILAGLRVSFCPLSDLSKYLVSEDKISALSELESLIFYCMKNEYKEKFTLNSEAQIGNLDFRTAHRSMW